MEKKTGIEQKTLTDFFKQFYAHKHLETVSILCIFVLEKVKVLHLVCK